MALAEHTFIAGNTNPYQVSYITYLALAEHIFIAGNTNISYITYLVSPGLRDLVPGS